MSEPMSNVDNFWLQMDDPTNLMIITGVMEFEKPFDMERFYATIENRLLKFRRFRQRPVMPITGVGTPSWEMDPDFDIRSHVQRVALPAPGDKAMLQEMVSDLTAIPLDRKKPMWSAHVIENYGEGCAVFFKIHHVIGDGIALVFVLLSMADLESDAPWPQKEPEPAPKKHEPIADTIWKKVMKAQKVAGKVGGMLYQEGMKALSNPDHLRSLANFAASTGIDMSAVLAKLLLMPPDPKTAFKGKLGVRKCVAWSERIPLARIRSVGKQIDGTINDVLVTCMSGALRRYLQSRNDRVNDLDLRVAMPINIRKPGTEFELGNKFSLILLALPVHVADPILRMREVKRRMDHLKTSPDAFVGFQALNAIGMSPSKVAKRAAAFFANKTSAVFTNVPGPRQPLYFAGQEVKDMMFWVPRSGQVSMGISILSYNGYVRMGLATDEGLVPDPETILEGFHDEFNYLAELVESGNIEKKSLVLNDRHQEALEAAELKSLSAMNGKKTESAGEAAAG